MGAEGHIADMITRMKNNQALKEQRKAQQKKINDLYRKSQHPEQEDAIHDVEISDENLNRIKVRIKRKMRHEKRVVSVYTLVITVLFISLMIIAAYLIFIA